MSRKEVLGAKVDATATLEGLGVKTVHVGNTTAPAYEGQEGQGEQALDHPVVMSDARNTTVLSGILGIARSTVHQWQLEGRLPNNKGATYRQCIQHLIQYLEYKSQGRTAGLAEHATIQKLELDRARTEQAWVSLKADRGELIDKAVLAEQFEPILLQIRQQMMSFARKNEGHKDKIDEMLDTWDRLGQVMLAKSRAEYNTFIEVQMQSEWLTEDGELLSEQEKLANDGMSADDVSQFKEVQERTNAALDEGNKSGKRGEGRADTAGTAGRDSMVGKLGKKL